MVESLGEMERWTDGEKRNTPSSSLRSEEEGLWMIGEGILLSYENIYST
jgi:hypothetical protein